MSVSQLKGGKSPKLPKHYEKIDPHDLQVQTNHADLEEELWEDDSMWSSDAS